MGEWVLEAVTSLTFFCHCENATSAGDNALDHSQEAQGLVPALLLASATASREKCIIPGRQCF